MKRDMRHFIAERAEHLAVLHLTRRADLLVARTSATEQGLDLLVTVRRDGASTGRMFGVEVESRMDAREVHAPAARPARDEPRALPEAVFPLCAFLFTMDDDRGYYRWLKEPAVGPNRTPELRPAPGGAWTPLDDEGLARIVESVNAWYDARRHRAA